MEYPSLDKPKAGAIRFNTDSSQLEIYDGNQWTGVESTSPFLQTGGTRGLYAGGQSNSDTIDFVTISTTGNATDFGNLISSREGVVGSGDRTRGVFFAGDGSPENVDIQHVTFASKGDAVDFGNNTGGTHTLGAGFQNSTRSGVAGGSGSTQQIDVITTQSSGVSNDFGDMVDGRGGLAGASSQTRGLFFGGYKTPSPSSIDRIEYVTTSTGGNAADFGDLTQARYFHGAGSNAVRAVLGSGQQVPSVINNIDYVTMATLGNSVDFGDSTTAGYGAGASSSKTRCVWGGDSSPGLTNQMDYVEIMTIANAVDFGNLNASTRYVGATSNGGGGL
tara:strand:- start:36 stop:1034 length:999 start_codon:yes stop_codon:yes gene_type:complete